jgi:hypothetical protein
MIVNGSPDVPGSGRSLAQRALYEAKTIVAVHPWLVLRLARVRDRGEVVRADTDILIEGYPRSANSFAVAAFRLAQGREVAVAQHTHAPGHVLAALRMHVPSLVLVREPEEAVLEFVIARPSLTLRQALRGWVRFYATLLPYRRRFVVGSFAEVTTDFGAVIRSVNDRFGTAFKEFDHTEENVRECFRQMEAYWRGVLGPAESVERYVGRPSEERDLLKEEMRWAYRARIPAAHRTRAASLYRSLVQDARP